MAEVAALSVVGCKSRRLVGDTIRCELHWACVQKPLGLVAVETPGWVSAKVLQPAPEPSCLLSEKMEPISAIASSPAPAPAPASPPRPPRIGPRPGPTLKRPPVGKLPEPVAGRRLAGKASLFRRSPRDTRRALLRSRRRTRRTRRSRRSATRGSSRRSGAPCAARCRRRASTSATCARGASSTRRRGASTTRGACGRAGTG